MSRLCAQILCLFLGISAAAPAQTLLSTASHPLQLADRGPVFYAVLPGGHVERLDAAHAVALTRRIALRLDEATVPDALRAIEGQTGLRFAYDRAALAPGAPVTLHADDITVAAALTQVLFDANVDVDIGSAGLASIHPRRAVSQRVQQQTGTIEGKVTDANTGAPIDHATVLLEGTKYGVTTGDAGEYRIANVPAGNYTVLIRLIGYVAMRRPTTVTADQIVRVSLSLARSVNELDRVVTTGTVVPTEVKAIPTPLTVVTDSQIEDQHPRSMMQVLRQAVPSAVAWDASLITPQYSAISVRGASTLTPGAGSMKIYIDGIETADHSTASLDPNSIDRIEVIRGPEAATIYGSDAIGGVVQIFTKHGDSTSTRPHVDVDASAGSVQSPYPGYSGALRQGYAASAYGGSVNAGYNLGVGYTHTDPWVPEGQSAIPSTYGGAHLQQGPLVLDISGRYFAPHTPEPENPDLASVWSYFSKPFYLQYDARSQTYGAHIGYTATPWWQNALTVGVDRYDGDGRQTQARLTTPADTFLTIDDFAYAKNNLAYNSTFRLPSTAHFGATIVLGIDHYDLTEFSTYVPAALNTASSIAFPAGQPPELTRSVVTNTGYFGQLQLGIDDALFITAGARAEHNSSFGPNLGTPVSPRIGISYARQIGETTIKLRSSAGEAIRPPDPYYSATQISPPFLQLANPNLAPERQRGLDAGVDVAVGTVATVSATYYNQFASELIEDAPLDSTGLVTQYENVGHVHNTGVEIEASGTVGRLQLRAQYAYTGARVTSLGNNYTGDLRVGDQALDVPRNTAGAFATLAVMRTTRVTGGVTYVGSWRDYNYLAEFACYGGTGPCLASTRDYLTHYPGFAKVTLSVNQDITRFLAAYASIDNLANTDSNEPQNVNPAVGRVSTIGVHLHY